MDICTNDNQIIEDNFLRAIEQSYGTLNKQIIKKKAVQYMIFSWQQMCKSELPHIEEINKEYLFTKEELYRIFNILPENREEFCLVLNKFCSNSTIYIHRNHYYSLPKIIESYWTLERIVPLTFFWHEGEFDKEEFDYE